MDDITNRRFKNVEDKIDGVEERLGKRMEAVEGKVDRLGEQIARNHAEQVQRFQVVIDKSEDLGRKLGKLDAAMESDRDRRMKALEDEVAALRTMVINMMGGGKVQ